MHPLGRKAGQCRSSRGIARVGAALSLPFALAAGIGMARAQDAGQSQFRSIYKELVETDTSFSSGSCTLAAQRMKARLDAAGYAEDQFQLVVPDQFPKQGNLVGQMVGSDLRTPPILLLAHIDVVEAKRSDWKRDPFTLFEENGYFYARGAIDDKAMATIFVDTLVRLRQEKFKPRRTIKIALTCGEETDAVFNGVQYLLANQPEALRAGLAINEGGKGALDEAGRPVTFGVQAGEKIYQDYRIVTTSPGGHSARPGRDNAITRLSVGLAKLGAYRFPAAPNEVTRNFFTRSAALYDGPTRDAMRTVGAGAGEGYPEAIAMLSDADPVWNAMMRTTCVATQLAAGHAPNALAQHAEANVNCRILPGNSAEEVRKQLIDVMADPGIAVDLADAPGPVSPPPPIGRDILEPIEKIAGRIWPGVPVIPQLSTGATDGRFLMAAGTPTYGISAMFVDPDGNGVHGLDERVRVKSLLDARSFLHDLVIAYASAK